MDEYVLREGGRFERDSAAWAQWASDHGWTYQPAAPELAGRYEPVFSTGAERYHHLLTTELHGLPVAAFEHQKFQQGKNGAEPLRSLLSFIVVRLPGLPPDEYIKMGAEKTIRKLGGTIPSGYYLKLVGDELVARRSGALDRRTLQSQSELQALQIASVPTSFWRPGFPNGAKPQD
ncbi:MAG TPA: hypothetical protein VHT75_17995 [Acidimicrobiales bacterium]|jgi:hypothetical protein|nr:hypothetical protein [Acidimicrobiales bacterium]